MGAESNGNGRKLFSALGQIPWVILVTLVGWFSFAVTFYVTTQRAIQDNTESIKAILATREKLLEKYDHTILATSNNLSDLNRVLALKGLEIDGRFRMLEMDIKRQEAQNEKFLQALDAQYNALNEHLRSHGGAPRR